MIYFNAAVAQRLASIPTLLKAMTDRSTILSSLLHILKPNLIIVFSCLNMDTQLYSIASVIELP